MESSDYKVDKLQVQANAQAISLEKFEVIEKICAQSAVTFLKNNFSNIKIRDRKFEPNVNILLAICWSRICGLSGIKTEVDQFVVEDITKMIFYSYSDLTIEEIYKAFELERYGIYDEKTEHFQLFNADYISTILKKYRVWKKNTRQQHHISENKISETDISDDEKEIILINGVNRVFQEYKETSDIDGPTEYLFDYLVEKGKIKTKGKPAVAEYFQEKLNEAKEQLKKESLKNSTSNATSLERKNLKTEMEKITSGKSPKIIIRAKRNILIEYFKKQIQLNQETIF